MTRIPLAGGDERRADDDGAEEEGASRSASMRGRDSRSIRHARDSTRFVVSDRHRPAPGPEEDLVTLRARPWKLAPPSVRGIHDAKLTERLIVNNAQVFEEIYRGDFFFIDPFDRRNDFVLHFSGDEEGPRVIQLLVTPME